MTVSRALRYAWLLIFTLLHQAAADCVGDTATYNESGLVVPFKNLCNKDISASVDFSDPTNEPSRASCIRRCVQKAPLCYGLDYVEDGSSRFNCWLMAGYFTENQTTASGSVNAAMLMPDFLSSLSGECIQLGIYDCWQKNGRVGTVTASSTAVSSATTNTASSASAAPTTRPGGSTSTMPASSSDSSLSTGAKAGIGAGIGVVALMGIFAAVFFLLRHWKKRNMSPQVTHGNELHPTEKYAGRANFNGMSELPSHEMQHERAELESPEPVHSQIRDGRLAASSR
ncbi:hypothetical protein DE146DRAFT_638093 [Phaeosphaeria sp. MPI-PUGE-AT-0046c]|nr:hypothetical protein DE146DRAFT_638093 [Phaeosphaeria sp. MPI-PUGE-AT-0046c]